MLGHIYRCAAPSGFNATTDWFETEAADPGCSLKRPLGPHQEDAGATAEASVLLCRAFTTKPPIQQPFHPFLPVH